MENQIIILRLGHRLPRDERISTHVCLVARAFGASGVFYSGQHDSSLESSVSSIVKNLGGNFSISYEKNYSNLIKKLKNDGFSVVHLTMYGIPLPEKLDKVKSNKKLLVIVGAEQVPKNVYELADFNIAITNQPHSEVAALAVFLDRISDGYYLNNIGFKDAKISIKPNEMGKQIIR
ncbi:tRNA (cytidine(56)-2'-O)-methyltransferase [Candidatus Micrarchaeota archaeon]|nr:tRNA (cytidine(56)-2'-O)-methyltransferase [Candidatus Micrarchaeota archaeon]